ncbi:hypothetical protein [Rhizobium laguerreae]|uniref:hypothetical protein n=1 Tax=Rhizobium laguerreae TaxID=1076926 RepID=UPI001441F06F|nr:hypothetical protein [Rhizobium laguerreae]NKN12294.1 hypothetical protein [Rhizobium laguerreae]
MLSRFRSRVILFAVVVLLEASPTTAQESFSAYTKSLIDLMNVFDKLDEAVATKIAANERYLLAKSMLRLSASLYQLRNEKRNFYDNVQSGLKDNGEIPQELYFDIQALKATTECLSTNFRDIGARLGAAAPQGQALEAALYRELHAKTEKISEIVKALHIDPARSNLKETILADAKTATDAADHLYRKSAEFAHVLDPKVTAPAYRPGC